MRTNTQRFFVLAFIGFAVLYASLLIVSQANACNGYPQIWDVNTNQWIGCQGDEGAEETWKAPTGPTKIVYETPKPPQPTTQAQPTQAGPTPNSPQPTEVVEDKATENAVSAPPEFAKTFDCAGITTLTLGTKGYTHPDGRTFKVVVKDHYANGDPMMGCEETTPPPAPKGVATTAPFSFFCNEGPAIVARKGIDVFRFFPDGSEPVNLSEKVGGLNNNPSPSPDCKEAVFHSFENADASPHLWIVDLAGKNPVKLIDLKTGEHVIGTQPIWSPDGSRIAFIGSNGNLWTIRPDGSGIRDLKVIGQLPAFAPDGITLAFTDVDGKVAFIFKDGSGLIQSDFTGTRLTWSAEGTSVTFQPSEGSAVRERLTFKSGKVARAASVVADQADDPNGSNMSVMVTGWQNGNEAVLNWLVMIDPANPQTQVVLSKPGDPIISSPDWKDKPSKKVRMGDFRIWRMKLAKQQKAKATNNKPTGEIF